MFSGSPYAAELRRGGGGRPFSRDVEAEYIRDHLADHSLLIRVTCLLAILVAAARGAEQLILGAWEPPQPALIALVFAASAALAGLAWSPAFGRLYLPVAQVLVPIRNVLVAIGVTQAATNGQLELLMLLPLMAIGPFFFMGLRFRAALLAVACTFVSFAVAAVVFGLPLPVALRSAVLLLLTVVASAIAARDLEETSRASFLESHLIAELAEHDTLTGVKNRRMFDEHLERLWQRAIDESRALAVLMVDIDHFKAYNDRYGHQAGDQTLRRVAQTLQALVPGPADMFARYGGEEFSVILYDADRRRAETLAEQMLHATGELAIEHLGSQAGRAVTISVGVALVEPSRERQSRGALQLADQALYEAKVRGRNRIEIMDEAAHRLLVTGIFAKSPFAGSR